jgi:hypothetical protein
MLEVVTLFPESAAAADVDAFVDAFVPQMKGTKGLRSIRVSDGEMMSQGGKPPYSRAMLLSFDSLADWMAWVLVPEREGRLSEFTNTRPLILFFETSER